MNILLQSIPTTTSVAQASSQSATSGKPLSASSTTEKSVEKQSQNKTAIDITSSDLWILIAIALIAGLLGGIYNYKRTKPTSKDVNGLGGTSPNIDWNYLATCVLGGIIAGALIPLFLQTIQSQLLNHPTAGDFTVFAGLCLIASISSNAFIDTLTKRVLDQINVKADAALQTANAAKHTATGASQTAADAHETSQDASSNAKLALTLAQTNREIINPIVQTLADKPIKDSIQVSKDELVHQVTESELASAIINRPALKFRSVKSVADETGQPLPVVESTFNELENQNKVKLVDDQAKIYMINP